MNSTLAHVHVKAVHGYKTTLFLDSFGDGEHETIPFEATNDVPNCSACKYKHNFPFVAPCFDCTGLKETGRSYFGKW